MLPFRVMSVQAGEIREWASSQGYELGAKGRIPKNVKQAYYEARGGAADVPADLPADSPASEHAPEGEAPGYQRDPEPRRAAAPGPRPGPRRAGPARSRDATCRDIQAKTALILAFPVGMWARRDEICGGAAVVALDPVCAALADIFADSPDIVDFFTATGGRYMKWLNLATAIQPVAEAAWGHHVRPRLLRGGGEEPFVPQDMSGFHAPSL